jgi:hypothetical protein
MAPNCGSSVSTGTRLTLLFILISQVISAGGVQAINLSAEAVSQSQIIGVWRVQFTISPMGVVHYNDFNAGMPGSVLVVNSMVRDFPDNCAIPQSEVALGETME